MPGLRDLKRRIKSVQSTRKITRAMQMVSAVKMRKAQNAVINSRIYAHLAWELISNLHGKVTTEEPLMATFPQAKKIGIVILGTNRTLVGSLNSNLASKIKELDPEIGKKTTPEVISEVVVYGRQARTLAQRMKIGVLADFDKEDKPATSETIYPLAKYITDTYAGGQYKAIYIVYNHFVSTLTQKPTLRRLLPFTENETDIVTGRSVMEKTDNRSGTDYLFEPTPTQVLEHLVPRIVESQIYQTILESDASEHSARMVMMKNATEAAGDLIANYTLTYNQLRQNKITTELAEITAGKVALE